MLTIHHVLQSYKVSLEGAVEVAVVERWEEWGAIRGEEQVVVKPR